MARIAALLVASAAASHKKHNYMAPGPCDGSIPGLWTGYEPQPLGDEYSLSWASPPSPGAWTATMVHGGGWGVGQGQFSADFTTTSISFDSGVKLTGRVSANCTQIDWSNDST